MMTRICCALFVSERRRWQGGIIIKTNQKTEMGDNTKKTSRFSSDASSRRARLDFDNRASSPSAAHDRASTLTQYLQSNRWTVMLSPHTDTHNTEMTPPISIRSRARARQPECPSDGLCDYVANVAACSMDAFTADTLHSHIVSGKCHPPSSVRIFLASSQHISALLNSTHRLWTRYPNLRS